MEHENEQRFHSHLRKRHFCAEFEILCHLFLVNVCFCTFLASCVLAFSASSMLMVAVPQITPYFSIAYIRFVSFGYFFHISSFKNCLASVPRDITAQLECPIEFLFLNV